MFWKKAGVSPLESRKQLLIAESEINRVRLSQDRQVLADELGRLADQAGSFNSLTTLVMPLMSGLAAFRSSRSASPTGKKSWLGNIFSGARIATTLWLTLRSWGSQSKK